MSTALAESDSDDDAGVLRLDCGSSSSDEEPAPEASIAAPPAADQAALHDALHHRTTVVTIAHHVEQSPVASGVSEEHEASTAVAAQGPPPAPESALGPVPPLQAPTLPDPTPDGAPPPPPPYTPPSEYAGGPTAGPPAYSAAAAPTPTVHETQESAALVRMAATYMERGNESAAATALRKALDKDPGNQQADSMLNRLEGWSEGSSARDLRTGEPPEVPPPPVWSWWSGRQWVRYDSGVALQIEAAHAVFAAGSGPPIVEVGGGRHVDLASMKQCVTAQPHKARRVKREQHGVEGDAPLPSGGGEGSAAGAVAGPHWSWWADTKWVAYKHADAAQLESAYLQWQASGQPPSRVPIGDQTRHVEFEGMWQIVTTQPHRQRRVQRVAPGEQQQQQQPTTAKSAAPPLRPAGPSVAAVEVGARSSASWSAPPPERPQLTSALLSPKESERKKALQIVEQQSKRGDTRQQLLSTSGVIDALVRISRKDSAKKLKKHAASLLVALLASRFDWALRDLIVIAASAVDGFGTAAKYVLVAQEEDGVAAVDEFMLCGGVGHYLRLIQHDNAHRTFHAREVICFFKSLQLATTYPESLEPFCRGAVALAGAITRHGGGELALLCVEIIRALCIHEAFALALVSCDALPALATLATSSSGALQPALQCLNVWCEVDEVARRGASEAQLCTVLLGMVTKMHSSPTAMPPPAMVLALQLAGRVCVFGNFKRRFLADKSTLEHVRKLSVSPKPVPAREASALLAKCLDDTKGAAEKSLQAMNRTELFAFSQHWDAAVLGLVLRELLVRVQADKQDARLLHSKYHASDRLARLLQLLQLHLAKGQVGPEHLEVCTVTTSIIEALCSESKLRTQLLQADVVRALVLSTKRATDFGESALAVQEAGLGLIIRLLRSEPKKSPYQFVEAGGIGLLATMLGHAVDGAADGSGASLEQLLRLVRQLSMDCNFHGQLCTGGVLQQLYPAAIPPALQATAAELMNNIGAGHVVRKGEDAHVWDRLLKTATSRRKDGSFAVDVLIWCVKQCVHPLAIEVRTASIMALGRLALGQHDVSSSQSRHSSFIQSTQALDLCIEGGVIMALTELLVSEQRQELADPSLEALTYLAESQDGRTFAAVPVVDNAMSLVGLVDIGVADTVAGRERADRAVRLLCRLSASNADYSAHMWEVCGLEPVLRAAFHFKADCGHLLCLWACQQPAALEKITQQPSAVDAMTAFAQEVRDEAELAAAVGGLEMILGGVEAEHLPTVVGQGGIVALRSMGSSGLADDDLTLRVLRLLAQLAEAAAQDKGVEVRMRGDGAVKWLRELASNTQTSEEIVERTSSILNKLGEQVDTITAGTSLVMQYPSYWSEQSSDIEAFVVDPATEEWMQIHDRLNGTMAYHRSGYGCIPGTTTEAAGFEVVQIKRLQNRAQWHKYFFQRKAFQSRYPGGLERHASSRHMQKFPSKMPCLDPHVNEYSLWHGTGWDTVSIIKNFGLDPRVSSVAGMFGGGCYFAEDSTKSNQYIPCPTCNQGSIFRGKSEECKCDANQEFPMLLCRVLLGDFHTVMKYDMSVYRGSDPSRPVRRPPNKPGSMEAYDSVFGETGANGAKATPKKQNPLRFREYITYDSGQVYPEYLITFKRVQIVQPPMLSGHQGAAA